MALEKKISWEMLAIFLNDLTPTLEKSKEVIDILLKELQTLQLKLDENLKANTEEVTEKLSEDCSNSVNEVSVEPEPNSDQNQLDHSEVDSLNEGHNDKDGMDKNHESLLEDRNEQRNLQAFPSLVEMNVNEIQVNIEGMVNLNDISFDNDNPSGNNHDENESEVFEKKVECLPDEKQEDYRNELEQNLTAVPQKTERLDQNYHAQIEINKHVQESKKKTECKICGIIVKHLKVHMIVHSDKKPKCKVCNKTFSRQDNLRAHERVHIREKSFGCQSCSEAFRTMIELKKHERIHDDNNSFKCETCGKVFSIISKLKSHQISHFVERPFQCKKCLASFKSISCLKSHQKTHKNGEVKCFECVVCTKQFTNINELRIHRKTHGEKPFECKNCSQSFSLPCKLVEHERIHTGKKPYECKYCQSRFRIKHAWKKHESIHEKGKILQCKTCDKLFSHSTNLSRHEQSHSSIKPFHCSTCDKDFRLKK